MTQTINAEPGTIVRVTSSNPIGISAANRVGNAPVYELAANVSLTGQASPDQQVGAKPLRNRGRIFWLEAFRSYYRTIGIDFQSHQHQSLSVTQAAGDFDR